MSRPSVPLSIKVFAACANFYAAKAVGGLTHSVYPESPPTRRVGSSARAIPIPAGAPTVDAPAKLWLLLRRAELQLHSLCPPRLNFNLHFHLLTFLTLLCFTSFSGSYAAERPLRWRWSNPLPHGNNVVDMLLTGDTVIQIAERGQLFSSTDFLTWSPRDTGTTNALRSITIFNGRYIVTGENGTILWGDSLDKLHLVDLGTADWLEGVTASPTLIVAVGDNAAIYTSDNGSDWQKQTVTFSNWLRSVAYGLDMFVAVGEDGTVARSLNGQQWQKLTPFTSQNLNKISWMNNRFVAAGDAGLLYTGTPSLQTIQWSPLTTAATNDLFALTVKESNLLVAGLLELRLSENRWTSELDTNRPYPAPPWTYYCAVADSLSYLVAGRTGLTVEGFKPNPTNSIAWLQVDDSLRNWLWDVKRFPPRYVSVGDSATILTSPNGVDWSPELVPNSATNSVFLGIGGRTNLAVAVGSQGTILFSPDDKRNMVTTNINGTLTTNQVSTLGYLWYAASPPPTTNDLQGITTFNNEFVACGGNGTILTSPDAINWTRQTTRTTFFLSSITEFPGGLVAVGSQGALLTSPDGVSWTQRNLPTTNWLYRVRYTGNKLIVTGENGALYTSTDGQTWTLQNTPTTRWLNDVTSINGTYFIVGNQGTVLSSPDAANWTFEGAITEKSLFGVDHHNTQLITVGIEGVILRTHLSPITDPIQIRYERTTAPNNITTNTFVFSGIPDQQFTFSRSTDLSSWQNPLDFEFYDSSGLAFYSQIITNPPGRQFFKATPIP